VVIFVAARQRVDVRVVDERLVAVAPREFLEGKTMESANFVGIVTHVGLPIKTGTKL
jgi:hypothetical protein